VEILLKAFEDACKEIDYYALDLSLPELERTFSELSTGSYSFVRFHALHGTYGDGLAWLSEAQNKDRPTCVLTLGSSIGNFDHDEAAAFLASIAAVLEPGDSLLVGLDACQDPERVFRAYNDSKGITENFYRNGLEHANTLIGSKIFKQEDWAIEGLYNEMKDRHEASYVSLKDISTGRFSFHKGEKLHLENAYKYGQDQSDLLWRSAGLISQTAYGDHDYRETFSVQKALLDMANCDFRCAFAHSIANRLRIKPFSIRF
jgi:EasF-like predicted methyltransferase